MKWISTQKVQASMAKAAHSLQIARIPDLESQYGDPYHPNI